MLCLRRAGARATGGLGHLVGPDREGTALLPVRTTPATSLAGITLPDAATSQLWDLGALRGTWLLTAIRHHL